VIIDTSDLENLFGLLRRLGRQTGPHVNTITGFELGYLVSHPNGVSRGLLFQNGRMVSLANIFAVREAAPRTLLVALPAAQYLVGPGRAW
jgi:hypothetical protein